MPIKNRQQLLTIVTLSAIGILALDRIVRPPLAKIYDDRAARITKLQQQVKEGTILQRRTDLRTRWDEIQKSSLPTDTTAAEEQFQTELNNWVQFSDVTLNNVAPTWKPGETTAYKTLECRVDASGSLDNLSRFLYALETDTMGVRVRSVELTAKDASGLTIGLGLQLSALVLTGADVKK